MSRVAIYALLAVPMLAQTPGNSGNKWAVCRRRVTLPTPKGQPAGITFRLRLLSPS